LGTARITALALLTAESYALAMRAPLVPCPSCHRHVRADGAASCPFCACALPVDLVKRAVPGTTLRLTRAATFAFTASLASVPLSACSSDDDGGPMDAGAVGPAYGAPVVIRDASVDALFGPPRDGATDAAAPDSGDGQVLDGLAPSDAESD
jgi:hypothetical protein